MSGPFDPYHRWLGIPPEKQPPNHYVLLGIELFEEDSDVIAHAADRQMAHVRSLQVGPNSAQTQKILQELATARVCLLNPDKKSSYDAELRAATAKPPISVRRPVHPPPVASEEDQQEYRLQPVTPTPRRFAGPTRTRSRGYPPKLIGAIGAGILLVLLLFVFVVPFWGELSSMVSRPSLRPAIPPTETPRRIVPERFLDGFTEKKPRTNIPITGSPSIDESASAKSTNPPIDAPPRAQPSGGVARNRGGTTRAEDRTPRHPADRPIAPGALERAKPPPPTQPGQSSHRGGQPITYNQALFDAYARPYEAKGYRRVARQVVRETGPVRSPTVYTAQRLILQGDVDADVAIMAQVLEIHGTVTGDIEFYGQAVTIKPGAVIKGNIRSQGAQAIRVQGVIEGKITGRYGQIQKL